MTEDSDANRGGDRHNAGDGTRALVTGGAGFIGSHLARRLLEGGARVTVVDNLSTGRLDNIADLRDHPGFAFIESDLAAALAGPLADAEPFDEVYHLAAAVGVDLVMKNPILAIEVNVEQTAAVLRYATDRGKPTVFVASSSEVYGKPTREVFSEDDDAVYGPTVVRRWSYALSKALDEQLALAYHDEGRCPAVVARFFNTVGPRQVGEHGMVLPRFVRAALANETIRVFGDGTQSRCFCDVRDVIEAVPKLVRTPVCHGRVFNIGSDHPITIAGLADLVTTTLRSASAIEYVPYDKAYPPGYEDLKRRRPDLSRVRSAIGFEPKTPLERTIADLADDIRRDAERSDTERAEYSPGAAK